MRVLIASATRLTGPGGIRSSVVAQQEALMEEGICVEIWEPSTARFHAIGWLAAALRAALVRRAPSVAVVLYGLLVAAQYRLGVRAIPDVVIYQDHWLALVHKVRNAVRCLVIHVNHLRLEEDTDGSNGDFGWMLSAVLERRAAEKADHILAVGSVAATNFQARTGRAAVAWLPPIPTCSSPVRPIVRHGKESGGLNLLTVGSLHPGKNHKTLFNIVASVREAGLAARLKVVGDGRMRAELEDAIQQMGLERCIEMLGVQEDVEPLLHDCDVYIHASTNETGPIAVLEAAACGLAVVAYDVGIIREVVPGRQLFLAADLSEAALRDALFLAARQGAIAGVGDNLSAARMRWRNALFSVLPRD